MLNWWLPFSFSCWRTIVITREKTQKKCIPSKLENPSKRGHVIPFSTLAKAALKVGRNVISTECHKPWLLYSRTKFKDGELRSFKHVLNDFQFLCGSVFQEIMVDKNKPDETVFKYLPVKISPAKVPLNCRITLAKHISKYAFNVEKQVSWLLIRRLPTMWTF